MEDPMIEFDTEMMAFIENLRTKQSPIDVLREALQAQDLEGFIEALKDYDFWRPQYNNSGFSFGAPFNQPRKVIGVEFNDDHLIFEILKEFKLTLKPKLILKFIRAVADLIPYRKAFLNNFLKALIHQAPSLDHQDELQKAWISSAQETTNFNFEQMRQRFEQKRLEFFQQFQKNGVWADLLQGLLDLDFSIEPPLESSSGGFKFSNTNYIQTLLRKNQPQMVVSLLEKGYPVPDHFFFSEVLGTSSLKLFRALIGRAVRSDFENLLKKMFKMSREMFEQTRWINLRKIEIMHRDGLWDLDDLGKFLRSSPRTPGGTRVVELFRQTYYGN